MDWFQAWLRNMPPKTCEVEPYKEVKLCLAAVTGGTTALSWSAGVVGILNCWLLMELLSPCSYLRLIFHADVTGFKPPARIQTKNIKKQGKACCASTAIACRRWKFSFWLCCRLLCDPAQPSWCISCHSKQRCCFLPSTVCPPYKLLRTNIFT